MSAMRMAVLVGLGRGEDDRHGAGRRRTNPATFSWWCRAPRTRRAD